MSILTDRTHVFFAHRTYTHLPPPDSIVLSILHASLSLGVVSSRNWAVRILSEDDSDEEEERLGALVA